MPNPENIRGKGFQKGKSGNPSGRPPGIKNWSTVVQNLLSDSKLADKLLSKKPGWWSDLPSKNSGNAIVVAMMIQAMGGDTKAATWLRRTGYGDKIDFTSDGKRVKSVAILDMRTNQPMQIAPMLRPKLNKKQTTVKKKINIANSPQLKPPKSKELKKGPVKKGK